jgi:hypothetical protein
MRKLSLLVLLALSLQSLQAQEKEKKSPFNKENAFVGGNVSLSLGQQASGLLIGAHPMYGYTLGKNVDVAAVLNIQYSSFKFDPLALINGNNVKSFLVGTGVSGRFYPIDFVFLQVQPEINFVSVTQKPLVLPFIGPVTERATTRSSSLVPSVLVGGGYKRGFNKGRTFTYLSVLFDVAGGKKSPYKDVFGNTLPIFRAGINWSLADLKKR